MSERSGGMAVLPVGTVTFLLTDVEGSTSLWEADPEAMSAAIVRHYEILDVVVQAFGGVRPMEQGEGDSIVAAFERPADAVHAAVVAQRALRGEPWPTTSPVKVRIAVHTGEARLRDAFNYAGPGIIRTARLRSIGHGGQVLVSGTTRDLAADELGGELSVIDLGLHRLKDLARPERVWQVDEVDRITEFPQLRSLDATPNNLPVALSSFIGRFDEIDTVARLVLDNRMVTLTGPGGVGKTRLAQQVAAEVLEAFPDGVRWIDLVGVVDEALVASAVNRGLRLPEDRVDAVAGIVRWLSSKRLLLVLDNCEHLPMGTSTLVAAVLRGCPSVAVMATSRASLSLPGELSWRLPPFSSRDAVALFADRATRVRQSFRLNDETASDVTAICDRLDGVPLAIELAAARCKVLTPKQIVDGLSDAIGLLSASSRDVMVHHQSIEASIQWSHSLLTGEEQVLLRRLSVFSSPFTLDGATAVVVDEALPARAVLSGLEQLVDQSLLQVDDRGDEVRFRMLETVRQFGDREVSSARERAPLRARHACHFAARALELWPLFHERLGVLLDQADDEFEDLCSMLEWFEHGATPEEHAAVAMACLPAIGVRHNIEAGTLGERAAARLDPLSALAGHLRFRAALGDPNSRVHITAGMAAAEASKDPELVLLADFMGAWMAASDNPSPASLDLMTDLQRALAESGETHFAAAHQVAADLHRALGRDDAAAPLIERGRNETACRRCGGMLWASTVIASLASGRLAAAREAADRSAALSVEVRDAGFIAYARLAAAEVAAYSGEPIDRRTLREELAIGEATGNPMAIGYLREARALADIVDGVHDGVEADLVAAAELLEADWAKRTEARLRRAALLHALGDLGAARAVLDEMRHLYAAWEPGPRVRALMDHRAAALALDGGDAAAAEELAQRALGEVEGGDWPPSIVAVLELLACIAVARESHIEAARLGGAASELREVFGYRYDVEPDRGRRDASLAAATEALGQEEYDAACAEGRASEMAETVAYARRARGERKRPSHGWDGLTPTELQVANLAVQGLTNAQIAERLFIGRETVKTHLSSVYAKVGVANRTQLVADVAKRGITS